VRYFQRREFACNKGECPHCGGVAPITPLLVDVCNYIREELGSALLVTSGFRCELHNQSIKGATRSYHKRGLAADLKPLDEDALSNLHDIACKDRFLRRACGLILYKTFLHVDIRTQDPFDPQAPYFLDGRG
jgi:zinc D-Ala-D-Ala carboxypeptidase